MANPTINPFSEIKTDPIRNFRFLVQFNPKENVASTPKFDKSLGFVSVSGFGVTVDPIAYREGGYNTTVHQLPGQTSFEPISFTRGQTLGGTQNLQWMRQLFAVVSARSTAGVGKEFRCDIDVTVLSHPNPANTKTANAGGGRADDPWNLHASMKFRIYNAWISSLVYGDLSAGGNGLMVEGMTVVHEGFDVVYADNYDASASFGTQY
jgi:phage tail-like protein